MVALQHHSDMVLVQAEEVDPYLRFALEGSAVGVANIESAAY